MAEDPLRGLPALRNDRHGRPLRKSRSLRLESLERRELLALIGVVPQAPLVAYNSTGEIAYTAAAGIFDLAATPLAFRLSSTSVPRAVAAPRELEIHVRLDAAGGLVGGVPGGDFRLVGTIDADGDGAADFSGTLLTGEVLQFGFLDAGTTDRYDFRFRVSGGAMQPFFAGKDIAVTVASENSTFQGSFAVDFRGRAKGNVGTTPSSVYVLSADKCSANAPYVSVVDSVTGKRLSRFLAYEKGYRGGVRTALADVDGDGAAEIITAPGRSRAPQVRVFRQNGTELVPFRFLAYDAAYQGGVQVAAGDVDGDGRADIVTAPSHGAAVVRVFRNLYDPGNPAADPVADRPYRSFLAFPAGFLGGATVAVADMGTFYKGTVVAAVALDGKAEILVGNGPGMRSTVRVFDAGGSTPKAVRTLLPLDAGFRGGIDLTPARFNADAIPDVIVGAGNGGKSRVQILDGVSGAALLSFLAFPDTGRSAPVHVAAHAAVPGGQLDAILVTQGTDGSAKQLRIFDTQGTLVGSASQNVAALNGMTFVKAT